MQLRKATRKQVKLRVGISAASGFGKTYSALLLAKGMVKEWDKIAVIDTENGSAELYSDLGEYNVITLSPPFSPERYIEAITACESAGMEAIIVDSTSHEWDGKGGCLEIQAQLGGRYQDWAKVTPRHNAFVQRMLNSSAHIITTSRRKQDYAMEKNSSGKTTVTKAGLKEIQRDGFEYELTLAFTIDNALHLATASKDRTGLFDNRPEFVISEETGEELMTWANSGVSVESDIPAAVVVENTPTNYPIDELGDAIKAFENAATISDLKEIANTYQHLKNHEGFREAGKQAKDRIKSNQ